MKTIFFNQDGHLRNGWWILFFIAFVALTRFLHGPITDGIKELGLHVLLEPVPFMLTLLATWACTRLRGEPLASVGFRMNGRWFKEFAVGTALGGACMLLVVGLIWAIGGVRLELDPARNLGDLAYGVYMFLFVALLEENLFRGFVFQRLIDGAGFWIAQLLLALLFAVAHWGNPGMEGATQFWASLDLAVGAVMLGLAYFCTRSLALPIGLHLGWNWLQGHILGFGVSGIEQSGWFHPVLLDKAQWLTGGEFGPEASIFAVFADGLLLVALWCWKGSAKGREVQRRPRAHEMSAA